MNAKKYIRYKNLKISLYVNAILSWMSNADNLKTKQKYIFNNQNKISIKTKPKNKKKLKKKKK